MCYITAILWHFKTQNSYWNEVEFILALLFEKSEKGHNSQYNLDKIARPDSLQKFMNTVKTMDWTCLWIQINNTVVFFFSIMHTSNIKKSKTKNM